MVKKAKQKASKQKKRVPDKWHATPLRSSFLVAAIIGFLVSAYVIFPLSLNFGIAFMLVFAAMFVAALISMTKAPLIQKRGYS